MKRGVGIQSVLAALVGCLLAAFVVEKITNFALQPTLTNDVKAYSILNEGSKSERYSVLKTAADQARQLASDEELKKFADFISRTASLNVSVGVETYQEAGSFSGMMKAFMTGLLDPAKGLQGFEMVVETWRVDYGKMGKALDDRYAPFFRQQAAATRRAKTAFWIALVLFGIGAWCLLSIPWVVEPSRQATEVSAAVESLGQGELVVCPSCGAKNRSKGITSGQKLVCGQCRTTLAAA